MTPEASPTAEPARCTCPASLRLIGEHSVACAARAFHHEGSDEIEDAVAGEDPEDDDDE